MEGEVRWATEADESTCLHGEEAYNPRVQVGQEGTGIST